MSNIPHMSKQLFKEKIEDNTLNKIYSNFSFKHLNFEEEQNENFILDYMKKFKLIIIHIAEQKRSQISSNNEINIIICVEHECIIIDSIDLNTILEILNKTGSVLINISSKLTKTEIEIDEEISTFIQYFQKAIRSNSFVKYTIRPIVAYLIRRYFYPSCFFKDQSFFSFEEHQNASNLNQKRFFKEEDFIELRTIKYSDSKKFSLVMYLNSFHIFMMKTIILNSIYFNSHEYEHEVDFCTNFSHRCFMPFYGFVMKNESICGFIYEFLTNGTLLQYYDQPENHDNFFSFMTINRIFQGIEFLHSNSLINRDLQPSNINLDYENIPYISDLDTIRTIYISDGEKITQNIGIRNFMSPEQFNGEKLSFSTDIFSFGIFIYYLFEKEDFQLDYNNIPLMTNFSEDIQNLYQRCVKLNPNDRPKDEEIRQILCEHITSIDNIPKYINQKTISISKIKSFYEENINLLSHESSKIYLDKYLNLFADFSSLIVYIGDLFIDGEKVEQNYSKAKEFYEFASNNSIALLKLGNIYHKGLGVPQNFIKARSYYELSADKNNKDAFDCLGNLYYNGQGVERSYLKAKEYFEKAGNNGDALFRLGFFYLKGLGVKQNYELAREYYEKAAALKNSSALNGLGTIYSGGFGVKKDWPKALKYYKLAVDLNNPFALLNMGNIYCKGEYVEQNYLKAKEYFEKLSELNNGDAFLALGYLYYNGNGVKKDFVKAREYFEKASELNNADALLVLGNIYYDGNGVKQDYVKARKYYELAAKQGVPAAYNIIGYLYDTGQGFERHDYETAKKYYELAAKKNFVNAFNNLGNLYLYGHGVPQDVNKAIELYLKSAELKNAKAYVILGNLYYEGKYVEQDYIKAKDYYEKALQLEYSGALILIGNLYYEGKGVEQSYSKALDYYEKGRIRKNTDANFLIGSIYYYGKGTDIDYVKARYCFELADQDRNVNALYYLAQIYQHGYGIDQNLLKAIEYYKRSAVIKQQSVKVSYNKGWGSHTRENKFYYRSNTELGLIYIIKYNDIKQSNEFLRVSVFGGYPFAKCCFGLLSQFFLEDKIGDALYMYEKASKNHFCLAEFNLGYFYEANGEIDKSKEHYLKALEYENIPIEFQNKIIIDDELEISKIFIICFINLKLSYFDLTNTESLQLINIKKRIINAIFKPIFFLLFQSNSDSHLFQFRTENIDGNNRIINLKGCIINNPLFNLNEEEFASSGWTTNQSAVRKEKQCRIAIEQIINTNPHFDYSNMKFQSSKTKDIINEKNDFGNQNMNNYSYFKEQIEKIFHELNIDNKFQLISNENQSEYQFNENIIRFKSKDDDIERCLIYPNSLFDLLFKNLNDIKYIIDEIIMKMKEIIYTIPYPILFGRIKKYAGKLQNSLAKNINESFYDGFDL